MATYYQNGYQQRYAWQWGAGQAGVMRSTPAPASSLGMADMLESGYGDPNYEAYPGTQKYVKCAARVARPCGLRANAAAQLAGMGDVEYLLEPDLGDWPLVRPQGFEPESLGAILPSLSDNEKRLAFVAVGAVAAWWLWKRSKRGRRRKNPWRVTSRTRGVTGSIVFRRKKDALAYAAERRGANKPATVAPYGLRRKKRRSKRR